MRHKAKILLFLFFPFLSWAQFSVYPLDDRYDDVVNKLLLKDSVVNFSLHPIISFGANNVYKIGINKFNNKVFRYLFYQNNFDYTKDDFSMHLNLLGNYSKGSVSDDSVDYFRNTRGFEIFGNLGDKIFYYTKFLENQAIFIPYIDGYIDTMMVIPGEGWWKPFWDNGRDFLYAQGYLTFNPIKNLFLELGHGKNFIGSGYRSLILSDNSFVYPYFKVYYSMGRFSLYSLWMENYVFKQRYYFYHYPKHSTYNILSYLTKRFNFSFVIATQWQTSDYQRYVNHFSPYFFVPFLAPVVYGLDNRNNVLLGWDINLHYKTFVLYSQLVVDKLNMKQNLLSTDNRFAYQVGLRTYDLFFNRFNFLNLRMLFEYNLVRPYTYSSSYPNQGFNHYNQALAHPLGSGVKEFVFRTQLRLWNVFFEYSLTDAICVRQGLNIYTTEIPYYERFIISQNSPDRIKHNTFKFSFLLNAHTGLRFFLGFDRRFSQTYVGNTESFYKFVGLTTDLGRFYYDF